jgi:lysophospholipase L1-like esterase
MTAAQNVSPGGPNPPQLNSLSADTRLVTLTIGGNDIGFSDRYTRGGDQITARINATGPKVDAVLDAIRLRSPLAKVLVVNYSAIFPHSGNGCWPRVPVTPADVRWLREKQVQLNGMLAAQAAANGAPIVDVYSASVGRDACAGSGTRWVEPYIPGNAAAPLHPNLRGMQAMAAMVVASSR